MSDSRPIPLARLELLPFADAQSNFYAAARHGLAAEVVGWTGRRGPLRELILDELLPLAADGLRALAVDEDDARRYLAVIEGRTRTQMTGAAWQTAFAERCGHDWGRLTLEYQARQRTGQPVHTWDLG